DNQRSAEAEGEGDLSSSLKYNLVAKVPGTMLHQGSNGGAHIFALEKRGAYFSHHTIRRAYAPVQICTHHPLTGGVGERRTICEPLGERSSLRFKRVIWNDSVHDVPPLKRCRVVRFGGVYDFASACLSSSFGQTLHTREQRCGCDRCLQFTEASP